MNFLNLLTDCLAILYLNKRVSDDISTDSYITKLVSDAMSIVPINQLNGEMDFDAQSIESLKIIINDMLINQASSYYNYDFLILKLKQSNKNNPVVYEYIQNIELEANKVGTVESIKILISGLINGVNKVRNNAEIKRKIQKFAFNNINNNDPNFDWESVIKQFEESVMPFYQSTRTSILDDPNIVSSKIDFGNTESIKDMFLKAVDSYDPEMTLKTPFKLLNKMCGMYEGFARPSVTSIAATTHNYKTGMMMDLFVGFALFNKPKLIDPKKKPLILLISYENEIEVNLATAYKLIREWEFKEEIDIKQIIAKIKSSETFLHDVSTYIKESLSKNGWEIQMIRCKPSETDYLKLFSLLDYYQMSGFEIVALLIDYLLMMTKRGCEMPAGTGSDSRDLVKRTRNYCMPAKISLISPFQLSTTAKEERQIRLVSGSGNPMEFIRLLRCSNMYDTCRSVEQELDLELFLDIIKINGQAMLGIGRGKHRGLLSETPEAHRECILPFSKIGRLVPDVNSETYTLGWNTITDAKNATSAVGSCEDWSED